MRKRKGCETSDKCPSKSSKVSFLAPCILLLEVPTDINTSLPVWDNMRSQQVDISWTVTPYSINVCFTPLLTTPEPSPSCNQTSSSSRTTRTSPQPATHIQPQIIIQPLSQHTGSVQDTPNVLLTLTQSKPQPCQTPPLPHPIITGLVNYPLIIPFPLIITQPQPVLHLRTPTRKGGTASRPTQPVIPKAPLVPKPTKPNFHTRSSCVPICERFLTGVCQRGSKCAEHHTPYPYHWQLWDRTSHLWVDMSPTSQVLVERLFCDVNRGQMSIQEGALLSTLYFDSMEVHNSERYDAVRRLSNTSDAAVNPHFPSEWLIFWWNNLSWEEYEEDVSKLLLDKMNGEDLECSFYIDTTEYKINFLSMVQINVTTGFQRKVRCRPVYRSVVDLLPHLRTGILTAPEPSSTPAGNFEVDPLEEFPTWYPPVWTPNPQPTCSVVEVPSLSLAYQKISSLFHQSLVETTVEILGIHQVHNVLHWDKFQRHKEHMLKRDAESCGPEEKHLFHGTPGANVEGICHNNFDPRVAGVNGLSYGNGAYFARDASFSNTYASASDSGPVRHMFLAKVLVGRMALGRCKYRRPPPVNKKVKHTLYDTCVDKMDNPSIFVVFDRCQCYPYYLIKYRDLPTVIEMTQ